MPAVFTIVLCLFSLAVSRVIIVQTHCGLEPDCQTNATGRMSSRFTRLTELLQTVPQIYVCFMCFMCLEMLKDHVFRIKCVKGSTVNAETH